MNVFLVSLTSGQKIGLAKNDTVIGRNKNSDITLPDEHISRRHCKITRKGLSFYLTDLDSSNGTFLNGDKVSSTMRLRNNDTISLGEKVASFKFHKRYLNHDSVRNAISKPGIFIPTIAGFVSLLAIAVYFFFTANPNALNIAPAIERMNAEYGDGVLPKDPEFYSALALNVERIKKDPSFDDVLSKMRMYEGIVRQILESNKLSMDFAFIPWAESGYNPLAINRYTQAGGMWQMIPTTARQYGLVVDSRIDERLDPVKATQAAALYLKDLVSEFGHNSFLLVLSAYNAGDGAVIYALRQIDDPINDRNYWYLSTHNLIPEETKKYVMTILALIVACSDKKSD
jgi:hypothetical protein